MKVCIPQTNIIDIMTLLNAREIEIFLGTSHGWCGIIQKTYIYHLMNNVRTTLKYTMGYLMWTNPKINHLTFIYRESHEFYENDKRCGTSH